MKLYIELLRHFLKAGVAFGLVVGVLMAMVSDWKVGLGLGFASGCILLLGVPMILTGLSTLKKRGVGNANGSHASR